MHINKKFFSIFCAFLHVHNIDHYFKRVTNVSMQPITSLVASSFHIVSNLPLLKGTLNGKLPLRVIFGNAIRPCNLKKDYLTKNNTKLKDN